MSSPGDVLGVANHDNRSSHCSNSTRGYRSFTPAKAMRELGSRREYPPPLPSLGMEMRRYSTGDGRLIIREEKTTRPLHDVFRADRSNGRLTLHFVRSQLLDRNVCVLDEDHCAGVFHMDGDEVASPVKHAGVADQKRVMT